MDTPLTKYDLSVYGLYEVENSPWIAEMKTANQFHLNHNDALLDGRKHHVARFKDVKFESVCRNISEITLSQQEALALIFDQIGELEN